MVHGVGDIEIVLGIEYHRFRRMEHRANRRLVVAVVPVPADSCDRRDDTGRPVDLSHAIAALVDDHDVALAVHRDPHDVVEAGLRRRLPVIQIHRHIQAVRTDRHQPAMIIAEIDADGIAGEHHKIARHQRLFPRIVLGRPATGDRRDHPGARIVTADLVGLSIGDVHDIVSIERNRRRPGQIDFQGRPVTVEPVLSRADHRRDHTGIAIDFPDPVAAGIADIEMVL